MIASPDEAMAVVLSLHVPSANITALESVLRDLIDAARQKGRSEGLGRPPRLSGRLYQVIYRFADDQVPSAIAHLKAWPAAQGGNTHSSLGKVTRE